ncbi:hypothetical protein EDC04DRAFT_2605751 [Pisolithus marmoratus]|nr:hypothetical protein EDC04DRAFT_2605751 [Pisolithus marmoratus]
MHGHCRLILVLILVPCTRNKGTLHLRHQGIQPHPLISVGHSTRELIIAGEWYANIKAAAVKSLAEVPTKGGIFWESVVSGRLSEVGTDFIGGEGLTGTTDTDKAEKESDKGGNHSLDAVLKLVVELWVSDTVVVVKLVVCDTIVEAGVSGGGPAELKLAIINFGMDEQDVSLNYVAFVGSHGISQNIPKLSCGNTNDDDGEGWQATLMQSVQLKYTHAHPRVPMGKMPLDSQPPPSPHGKVMSTKHCCSMTEPCPICLSDVGRQYHSFPKGTFKAHFMPPIFPKFVLHHFASHQPIWTWMTKDGPNKGKSFQVPTIPIVCEKTAPHTVHWVVVVFHSFKTHLNPVTIDADTGKVHQGWIHLYQNNLYVHLQSLLKVPPPLTTKPSPQPLQPTGTPQAKGHSTTAPDPVTELCEGELFPFNSSSSASLEASSKKEPSPITSHPPKKLLILYMDCEGGSGFLTNPPSWLVTFLQTPDLPPHFTVLPLVCTPLSLTPLPGDTTEAVRLRFGSASPLYVRAGPSGAFAFSTSANCDLVTHTYDYPPDPSVLTICP